MTTRDRLMLMGLAVLVVLGAGWFLAVAPERKQAAEVATKVSTARQQLESAKAQLASAQSSQAQYASAYASIVRLGKAVPPQQEVPSLVYELEQASNEKYVDFASITTTTGKASGATSSTAATSATASAGLTPMPFTFIFKGSFFSLYHLFDQLQSFAVRTRTGSVRVSGRLLTIQGVTLETKEQGGTSGSGASGASSGELTGTITATAYVLPSGESATAGASPSGPAGSSASQAVSGSGSQSSTSNPAVAQVNP